MNIISLFIHKINIFLQKKKLFYATEISALFFEFTRNDRSEGRMVARAVWSLLVNKIEAELCIGIGASKAQKDAVYALFEYKLAQMHVLCIKAIASIALCLELAVDIQLNGRAVSELNADLHILGNDILARKINNARTFETKEIVH